MIKMEITITSIISFVTLVIGFISKKLKIVNKKYIPYQNILIGIVSGFIVYMTGLDENIYKAVISALIASLSAGGIYDALPNIKKEDNKEMEN